MTTELSFKADDLQKWADGVVKLEVKVLSAGLECAQVWMAQATKLSAIASDTLQAFEKDQANLSDTADRLIAFGKQNAEALGSLSTRLNARYCDQLGRWVNDLSPSSKGVKRRAPDETGIAPKRTRSASPAKPKAAVARSARVKADPA